LTCNRKPCGSQGPSSSWKSCWAGKPLTKLDQRSETRFAALPATPGDQRLSALPDSIKSKGPRALSGFVNAVCGCIRPI
jgi:hypothetical protein